MKKESTNVGFALQGIKTEQFAIFEDSYASKKETDLGTELKFKLDQTNKQIGVFLGFEFMQGKKYFLKFKLAVTLKLKKVLGYRLFKKKIIVPKNFLVHLAMITTGTSRGILFAKTEGTEFSNFIIPTLNVAEMIQEDAIFDIE